MGLSYEESKKVALRVISILGVITIVEVIIALLGKGYIISGFHLPWWFVGILMIVLTVTKAYYIVYEFMHMKYEVPSLVKSVLLPTLLLVWAIIAFFWEGSDWKNRRSLINDKNSEEVKSVVPEGSDIRPFLQEDYNRH
ncbi:MAG: cytochrome C oxidase subunit IV family protein [Saprospiraceae bacterium]|nr:cytochrome C oxidase subunit IV family protein [Saprospiraceae bacterium]